MKHFKYVILIVATIFAVFIGGVCAIRFSKQMDEKRTVSLAASKSYDYYSFSSVDLELFDQIMEYNRIVNKAELLEKMAKDSGDELSELKAQHLKADAKKEIKHLESMQHRCKKNMEFFSNNLLENKRLFEEGCWLFYKKHGTVFDEKSYKEIIPWETELEYFSQTGGFINSYD